MKASRRAFVKALAAATLRRAVFGAATPSVTLIVGDRCRPGRLRAPTGFAVFRRAYTVCPEPDRCLQSILTGRYPHAHSETPTPSIRSLLEAAGVHCDVLDLARQQTYSGSIAALEAEGERATSTRDPNRVVVVTA